MTSSELAEHRRLLAHLRAAHRVAGLGSWEADLHGERNLYWSPEVHEITGLPHDFAPNFERYVRLIHPDDRAPFLELRSDAMRGERPYAVDLRLVRPDGTVRHVRVLGEIVRDQHGEPERVIGTIQDRTEEIAELRQLRSVEAERRDLLQRLIDRSDHERRRLADHLSAGPIEHLRDLRERLARVTERFERPALAEALDALDRSIDALAAVSSSMAAEPAQGHLEDIVSALVQEAQPAGDAAVRIAADVSLRPSAQAALVRVIQEALHNVRKHAAAHTVLVEVWTSDGGVTAEVTDDGVGFDVETTGPRPGHLGLVSMRDRIDALGGELRIRSRPGRTSVRASIPQQPLNQRRGEP